MRKLLFLLSFLMVAFTGFSQSDTSAILQGRIVSKAADATIVSTVWTQVSGKSVTIESPSTLRTKVSNLTAGEYKFSLKVTDNFGLFGTTEVEVIVLRYNQAPVADATESRIVIQLRK